MLWKPYLVMNIEDNKIELLEYKRSFKRTLLINQTQWSLQGDRVYETIGEFFKTKSSSYKNIYLIFSTSNILSREILLPQVHQREFKSLLEMHMDEYFPVNLSGYQWQYQIIEEINKKNEKMIRVLVIAIPQNMIEQYIQLVEPYGFDVKRINYFGICLATYFGQMKKELVAPVGIIYFNQKEMTIFIIERGRLLFNRHYLYDFFETQIYSEDCRLFLDFYTSRNPDKLINDLFVVGDIENINFCREVIEKETGKKVCDLIEKKETLLEGVNYSKINFLSKEYRQKHRRSRRNRHIHSVFCGLWIIVLLLWFYLRSTSGDLDIELQKLQLEVKAYEEMQAEHQIYMKLKRKGMIQDNLLITITTDQELIYGFLEQINSIVKQDIYILTLQYRNHQLSIVGKSRSYKQIGKMMEHIEEMEQVDKVQIERVSLQREASNNEEIYMFTIQCIFKD